jgi:hypothetical protein
MELSEKLDALQGLARQNAEDVHRRFLLEVLAEHAGEPEFTGEFVAWVRSVWVEQNNAKQSRRERKLPAALFFFIY